MSRPIVVAVDSMGSLCRFLSALTLTQQRKISTRTVRCDCFETEFTIGRVCFVLDV